MTTRVQEHRLINTIDRIDDLAHAGGQLISFTQHILIIFSKSCKNLWDVRSKAPTYCMTESYWQNDILSLPHYIFGWEN